MKTEQKPFMYFLFILIAVTLMNIQLLADL